MLHVNPANILFMTETWDFIVEDRHRFYTKNLKAFVGYARKQAAKYGLKGTRLAVAEQILETLDKYEGHKKLRDTDLFQTLPVSEHCYMITDVKFPTYQWCGKQVQNTVRVDYFREMVVQFIDHFGERARQAQANEGIDWKAMSHAIRAAYEVKSILTKGTIEFPLDIASVLLQVKLGQLDFTTQVLPLLEDMMEEVESLSEKSSLPEKVNRRFWDEFIIDEVHEWR
jgi:hypothetical protein